MKFRYRYVCSPYHEYHSYNCIVYYVGDQPGADIGPMISPAAKQRAIDLVQSGVDQGAELILDGRDAVVPGYEKGNFFGPTIISKVQVGE